MNSEFQVPRISADKVDDNKGTFTVEPLDKCFGYTFGNSLRRVLLSSLGGAAITSVRIEGVAHEFSTVPGVKEDVTDIVLNLKDLVVRMHTDADEVEAPLVATGPGEVKAKDIDLPSGVEILNPEAPIATLEKKTKLEVYLTIGRGRGYSPADELGSNGAGGEGGGANNGLDEILIEELELGVRSYNCLKRAGVQTVGDLVRKSRAELNAIPNFGSKSIEEVIETLHARGLDLQ